MLPPVTARPEHVERALKARYQDAMNILRPQGRELDLLIVILPDNNGSLYGNVLFQNTLKTLSSEYIWSSAFFSLLRGSQKDL